ncbi:TPA: hypothetical protein ACGQXI_004009 [Klebsiella michiganensis]|nr:hypothetical protein [Klebsiella michiganensis]HCE9040128.1 hypothetical protein [Klebsiella michiganensis]HCE9052276.1 hypothetical protein [Klebsiella michiganensis]
MAIKIQLFPLPAGQALAKPPDTEQACADKIDYNQQDNYSLLRHTE